MPGQHSQCEERTQDHPDGIANLVVDWTPLLDQFVTAFFANKILFVWVKSCPEVWILGSCFRVTFDQHFHKDRRAALVILPIE